MRSANNSNKLVVTTIVIRVLKSLGIIQDQLSAGIIETVSESSLTESSCHIHYLPHHAVIKQGRQTTKIRIVYDGSAKGIHDACSLNDCLQTGPNFIPKLFNTLIKFRTYPVALVADIEKAFLMIGISNTDRNMLRFLWLEEPTNPNSKLIHLRFTRLVFELRPSPAILGAVLSHHLETHRPEEPELVELIETSLYVDDLICGAEDEAQAFECYSKSKTMLANAGMNLKFWQVDEKDTISRILTPRKLH